MSLIEKIRAKAQANVKKIVLPEGDEPRTVKAAEIIKKEGLAEPVLIGVPEQVKKVASEQGADITGIEIVDRTIVDTIKMSDGRLQLNQYLTLTSFKDSLFAIQA